MKIEVVDHTPTVSKGTAGLRCHVGGESATVSAIAAASGGAGKGHFVETYH